MTEREDWTRSSPAAEDWTAAVKQAETWSQRPTMVDAEEWLPRPVGGRPFVVDADGRYVVDRQGRFVYANG